MKKIERRHVSLREEKRGDNGNVNFVVTWTPKPNDRRRATFSNREEAGDEADRIEEAIEQGYRVIAETPRQELAAFLMLRNETAPKTPLHEIMRFYLDHGSDPAAKVLTSVAGKMFIESRSSEADFELRTRQTVRQHINRFILAFGSRLLGSIGHLEIKNYLNTIGNTGKTRLQHLITLKSFFRWARDTENFLPHGQQTVAEKVTPPKVSRSEHEIYSPEEFVRLLVFTPTDLVMFMVLGQLAGIRAEERLQLLWNHWRENEDNKIVCDESVTKTNKRRRVDVLSSLAEWMRAFRGKPLERMVQQKSPYKHTSKIAKAAGVPLKDNALRAGYASYHLEAFDNPALTAKNDGHSVEELETTYKSISGVTKKTANEILATTPRIVLAYARKHGLPEPEWASKIAA